MFYIQYFFKIMPFTRLLGKIW